MIVWLLDVKRKKTAEIVTYNDLVEHIEIEINQTTKNKLFWEKLTLIIRQIETSIDFNAILSQTENIDDLFQNDYLGNWFQKNLFKEDRKVYAVNYTNNEGSAQLTRICTNGSHFNTIIDPFCGSGRLIIEFLKTNSSNRLPVITIVDIIPFAVILSYCRILHFINDVSKYQNINPIIHVSIENAFDILSLPKYKDTFDLVLINPPFTRTHRISSDQRKSLQFLDQFNENMISGQPGLHIYALLLSDYILQNNGVLAAVLPSSSFSSISTGKFREFILKNRQVKSLTIALESKAFSDGSELKELLFLYKKNEPPDKYSIEFRIMSKQSTDSKLLNTISRSNLIEEWNWNKFFENSASIKLEKKLIGPNLIKSGDQLNMSIIRGLEMYGPDFFCLPNKEWQINKIEIDSIQIQHRQNKKILSIKRQHLQKILRKPGLYSNIISPQPKEFILSITNDSDESLQEYITITKNYARSAQRKYGDQWYKHVYHQILAKNPFAHVFFVDKVGLQDTSIMCHYIDEQISCTKNFYLLLEKDEEKSKLMAAWINSSIYLFLYLINRREIGGSYGRMQIADLRQTKLFLDIEKLSTQTRYEIISLFDKIRKKPLENLYQQIKNNTKRDLDLLFLRGMLITERVKVIDELYTEIQTILEKLQQSRRK